MKKITVFFRKFLVALLKFSGDHTGSPLQYISWIVFALVLSMSFSVQAIDEASLPAINLDEFPSYLAVTETELPSLNRYELAQRFLGIELALPVTAANPIERQIGDIDEFYVSTTSAGQGQSIQAELVVIGEHVYFWLELGASANQSLLEELSASFDREVYEFVRGLWGEEALGLDGESRLHILFTSRLPREIGGFYASANQYPSDIVPLSNERDMLTMSANNLLPQYHDWLVSSAAHEFQHLLFEQSDTNEDSWINEGFSQLTEHLLGYGTSNYLMDEFAQMPAIQLNAWGLAESNYPNYGASMLYMIYLYERFGLEAVQALHANPNNGFRAINQMLEAQNAAESDIIFADWVMANILREETGLYAYSTLPENLMPMRFIVPPFSSLPQEQSRRLHPYATHYYQLLNPPQTLSLNLSMSDTVALYPTTARSGDWAMYSLRGDNSNPTLTRRFDLRNVSSAELEYSVWYSLEEDWDYAYLSVSRDEGQTWEMLPSPNMTTSNRFGRSYGIGYTGESATWLEETVPLDAYLGREILLRFEMLTDDALNYTGVVLDDIRIEALGYQADFETDLGDWQSEGWIRSDNRLPLRAWLQVAEIQGEAVRVSRFLADGDGTWTLSISPETTAITIVFSPFAPMTTEMVDYRLRLE